MPGAQSAWIHSRGQLGYTDDTDVERAGDLVIWDNCRIAAGRTTHPRDLRRVTTKDLAPKPVGRNSG